MAPVRRHLLAIVLLFSILGVRSLAATDAYRIDPGRSRATINVGKSGVFSFAAGHTHVVSGPIASGGVDVDTESLARSHVRLTIAGADLKVSPQGEPADDVPKVQETMDGEKVLDVRRHPEITFDSTSVTVKERRGDAADLVVAGRLTIRGVTQVVSIPAHVTFDRQRLSATGRFAVKQSAFGITPISVAGVVSVKDLLEIEFSVGADK